MITEEQKYFSGILKNLGFAFFTPIGSIMFQTIVFKKSPLEGYVFWAMLISLIGCLFFYLGYIPIKEKK